MTNMSTDAGRGFEADPLRHIPPALLNSADIQAYQEACKLIRGEEFDTRRLKAACYKVLCRGDVYWSDSTNHRKQQRIDGDQSYTLPRNGIAYISPDVQFCLPDFIAARFNLTIGLVHRGLLLGTGPLIDPGFEGRLLIPLHNLTTRDVELKASDGLIWVEFTKLSPDQCQEYAGKKFDFVRSFKPEEKNRPVEHYFAKTDGVPPQSSLADNARRWQEALDGARGAQKEAEALARRFEWIGIGAMIAAIVAVLGLVVTTLSLVRDANEWVSDHQRGSTQELQLKLNALRERLDAIDQEAQRRQSKSVAPDAKAEK